MHLRKKLIAAVIGVAAIGASAIGLSVSTASSPSQDATTVATTTPIKHVVVIFGENISFDHYFATYPFATNPANEPQFTAAPGTPNVNGLNDALQTANPNLNNPARLDRSQALTCDQNHGYSAEQSAFDSGLMDQFVQKTTGTGCTQTTFPDQGNYGPNGIVMDYYDGNTVTALWNYAQHYTLNDNSYSTQFGPSSPGAINVISGQTNGATAHGGANSAVENGTLIGDTDPLFDQCSNAGSPLNSDGTPGGMTGALSGANIGDLLNRENLTWGWFQGGFTPSAVSGGRAICGTSHDNIANSPSADYSAHHEPFQYYASTSNPNHLSPTSVAQVGVSDPSTTPAGQAINHQYDLSWFNDLMQQNRDLPAVSYLKAPEYEDGHAGYSDPLDEQRFLVDEINMIEQSRDWSSTAIVLAYDDSDGWYDHQMGPIIRQSQDTADTLNGPGKCGSAATPPAQNDRCGVGPRQPLLVISPWAKQNFVDNTFTDQASIVRFIEDNWNLGRIGNGSADSAAGNLDNAFDFNQKFGHAPAIILDDNSGEVTKVIQPHGQVSGPSVAPAALDTGSSSSSSSGSAGSSSSPGPSSSTGGRSTSRTVTVVKLPDVACSHVTGRRALVLTCTTRGGSQVQTLIRARMYKGKKLVSNVASLVKHDRVKLTLSLGRRSRGGRYMIRLSIDAAGRVGSQTRYVRVR
ncbi:MAG TPA: alkaline phosphatase family protein [Solirubrobacteraceae bacterium]|nr:alkaline phosphatase family protein [Solirubrobacteraceae bacterium]